MHGMMAQRGQFTVHVNSFEDDIDIGTVVSSCIHCFNVRV